MEAEEHFYTDDPSTGPPDARTTLNDVNYFFIGNGYITAAVQLCLSGEGTPLGLILMHPEIFGPKRTALTFHSQSGLAETGLRIVSQESELFPELTNLEAWWGNIDEVPAIHARWDTSGFTVLEKFYCPDRKLPIIVREIHLTGNSNVPIVVGLKTGIPSQRLEKQLTLKSGQTETCFVEYQLIRKQHETAVEASWKGKPVIAKEASNYWGKVASCQFDSSVLNHMFTASQNQLPANIADSGRLDASIWQYNLEWVRDQSMIAFGLTVSGHFEPAAKILNRLWSQFVTEKGDTIDSSRERPTSEVELDQNGELLLALRTYVDWTGDLSIVKKHWKKVRAAANFPLSPVFRQPGTALLHNQREYWERHALYGIEDGIELAYQLFVSMGLASAAYLADLLGHKAEATKWRLAAEEIKHGMLFDPKYALTQNGHFIKRRHVNGEIQNEVSVKDPASLPKDIPILAPGKHYLNPDSSAALPVAFEFIDPESDLAKATLEHLEALWNQRWENGGYGRYNVSSEPDSPGPWPFPSLFIARAYFEMGQDERVWRILNWLNSVPGSKSGAWFEFYGQRPVPPFPQVGIIPWTWAEVLVFFVHHVLGIRPGWNKLLLRPRLLSGIEHVKATIRIRNCSLKINLMKVRDVKKAGFRINGALQSYDKSGIWIDIPKQDLEVDALLL